MRTCCICIVAWLGLATVLWAQSPGPGNVVSSVADRLKAQGIEPDAGGLGGYLRGLHPTEAGRKQVAGLIADLGSDDYNTREAATRKLVALPVLPTAELRRAAADSPDAEVRQRAQQVLDEAAATGRQAATLHAVFQAIQMGPVRGLASEVLAAVPLCEQPYLQLALRRALAATVTAEDGPALRQALAHASPEVRLAAIAALPAAVGDKAADDLLPLLSAKAESLRLAAATSLAELGRRQCLAPLADLLGSEEAATRAGAWRVLRAATGQKLPPASSGEAAARLAAVRAWRGWIDGPGQTAKLQVPLKLTAAEWGRTLVVQHGSGKITEFDDTGKETWSVALPSAFTCQGLPNGHRLIATYGSEPLLVEFDEDGKEVARLSVPCNSISAIHRTEDGHTLLAHGQDRNGITEVDEKGNAVKTWQLVGTPCGAQALDNGNLLVAFYSSHKVSELTREGKVVWEVAGLAGPYHAKRLDSGNTLIAECHGGKVSEYDPAGKRVWEHAAGTAAGSSQSLYAATRLADGNTLFAITNTVSVVDPAGKTVWSKTFEGSVLYTARY